MVNDPDTLIAWAMEGDERALSRLRSWTAADWERFPHALGMFLEEVRTRDLGHLADVFVAVMEPAGRATLQSGLAPGSLIRGRACQMAALVDGKWAAPRLEEMAAGDADPEVRRLARAAAATLRGECDTGWVFHPEELERVAPPEPYPLQLTVGGVVDPSALRQAAADAFGGHRQAAAALDALADDALRAHATAVLDALPGIREKFFTEPRLQSVLERLGATAIDASSQLLRAAAAAGQDALRLGLLVGRLGRTGVRALAQWLATTDPPLIALEVAAELGLQQDLVAPLQRLANSGVSAEVTRAAQKALDVATGFALLRELQTAEDEALEWNLEQLESVAPEVLVRGGGLLFEALCLLAARSGWHSLAATRVMAAMARVDGPALVAAIAEDIAAIDDEEVRAAALEHLVEAAKCRGWPAWPEDVLQALDVAPEGEGS